MKKKLLIIGLDPGTTIGYAILNIFGKVIAVGSGKNMDLSILIRKIIEFGKPLIVASDKKTTPAFVYKFATKTGAKLVSSKNDLLVSEKKLLVDSVDGFKTKNTHESDALASALYGFRESKKQIEKVQKAVADKKILSQLNSVIEMVVLDDFPISLAIKAVENNDSNIKSVIKDLALKDQDFDESLNLKKITAFEKLYDKIRIQDKSILLLKKQVGKYTNEIGKLRKENKTLKSKLENTKEIEKKKAKKNIALKTSKVSKLKKYINSKNKEIMDFKRQSRHDTLVLSRINKSYVLKKLENFGSTEYNRKKKLLNLMQKDILYVKNPSIFSESVLRLLKNKVTYVITPGKIPKIIKDDFIFLNDKGFNIDSKEIDSTKDFVVVDKKKFDLLVSKRNILTKVVNEYKEKRKRDLKVY